MKNNYLHHTITLLLMMFVLVTQAQELRDTTSENSIVKKEKKGSIFAGKPGKAMAMSLIIPGAGQIYNKSYIRVPFVWGAVGGMGAYMVIKVQQYNCIKEAYVASVDGTPFVKPHNCPYLDGLENVHDPATLRILRDDANTARQRAILLFALVWLAQGIDAYVDAHLKDFNISDDLTFDFTSKSFDDPVAPMRMGLYVSF